MPQIRAENVEKRFGEVQALSRLNLAVERNEFVSILGPSGCGKTTLLRIVAGLIAPDGGAVYVDDEPVTALQRIAAARRPSPWISCAVASL